MKFTLEHALILILAISVIYSVIQYSTSRVSFNTKVVKAKHSTTDTSSYERKQGVDGYDLEQLQKVPDLTNTCNYIYHENEYVLLQDVPCCKDGTSCKDCVYKNPDANNNPCLVQAGVRSDDYDTTCGNAWNRHGKCPFGNCMSDENERYQVHVCESKKNLWDKDKLRADRISSLFCGSAINYLCGDVCKDESTCKQCITDNSKTLGDNICRFPKEGINNSEDIQKNPEPIYNAYTTTYNFYKNNPGLVKGWKITFPEYEKV
tara:strand:- start:1385 stop:2170 length:786 start_codon:yes stop_codon:yes gene_type:complete